MKLNKTLRHVVSAALGLLLTAALLALPALAYDPVPELNGTCRLTINYPYEDVQFDLYRVADVDEQAIFHPNDDFAGYPVVYRGLDQTGWRKLALTLAGYVDADQAPCVSATTAEGKAVFENLENGLYLVVGRGHLVNGYRMETIPTMICLPNWTREDGWIGDVAITPKPDRPPEGETTERHVLKVWDDGGRGDRPGEVTVQLLCDGEVYDTVTLNAGNNWTHQWLELESGHTWRLIEKDVPAGYTVDVDLEGLTFVVTNSRGGDTPDPPDPPGPDRPDPDRPGHRDPPGGGDTPDTPDIPTVDLDEPDVPLSEFELNNEPDDPRDEILLDDPDVPLGRLPQTGQLWWPVPVLALAGLLLFLIGWARRRGARNAEE